MSGRSPLADRQTGLASAVTVIDLEVVCCAALHARLVSEVVGPSLRHPLSLVLALCFGIAIRHGFSVFDHPIFAVSPWGRAGS